MKFAEKRDFDDPESKPGKKHKEEEADEEFQAMQERDRIRKMIRKENERTRRREVAGKNKTKDQRDADRDISEKIALG